MRELADVTGSPSPKKNIRIGARLRQVLLPIFREEHDSDRADVWRTRAEPHHQSRHTDGRRHVAAKFFLHSCAGVGEIVKPYLTQRVESRRSDNVRVEVEAATVQVFCNRRPLAAVVREVLAIRRFHHKLFNQSCPISSVRPCRAPPLSGA
jgi:hypothetical protein